MNKNASIVIILALFLVAALINAYEADQGGLLHQQGASSNSEGVTPSEIGSQSEEVSVESDRVEVEGASSIVRFLFRDAESQEHETPIAFFALDPVSDLFSLRPFEGVPELMVTTGEPSVVVACFEDCFPVLIGVTTDKDERTIAVPVVPHGSVEFRFDHGVQGIPGGLTISLIEIGDRDGEVGTSGTRLDRNVPGLQSAISQFPSDKVTLDEINTISADLLDLVESQIAVQDSPNSGLVFCPLARFSLTEGLEDVGVKWLRLPAGRDYAWRANSPQVDSVRTADPSSSAIDISGLGPETLGALRIEKGSTSIVGLRFVDRGEIRGRLGVVYPESTNLARVRLFRLLRPTRDGVQQPTAQLLSEAMVDTLEREFRFENLRPGEYRVSVLDSGDGEFSVIEHLVDLLPGETAELGDLYPIEGSVLWVDSLFQGSDGATVPPERVLEEAEGPTFLRLSLAGTRFSDPLAVTADQLFLPVGKRVGIRGLPEGRWTTLASLRGSPKLRSGVSLLSSNGEGLPAVDLRSDEEVQFRFHVLLSTQRVEIAFEMPDESKGLHYSWSAIPEGARNPTDTGKLMFGVFGAPEEPVVQATLSPGRYRICLSERFNLQGGQHQAVFANELIQVDASVDSVTVPTQPGRSVRVSIVDSEGSPIAGASVAFDFVGENGGDASRMVNAFSGTTAGDGTFQLNGVPGVGVFIDRISSKRYEVGDTISIVR